MSEPLDASIAPAGAPAGPPAGSLAGAPGGPLAGEPASSAREPSIFLISLHILMWTNLVCGFVMMLVVFLLN